MSRVQSGNTVFLSSGDRDLGLPISVQLGSQASSVWGMELCIPLKLSKGCQASGRVQALNLGFFKRISMGDRSPILLWGDTRCSIGASAVESGLIWSGGGTRSPFSLQQDPRVSTRDLIGDTGLLLRCKGKLGFLLSWSREWALISMWSGKHGALLDLWWETRLSSLVVMGISGPPWVAWRESSLLSSFERELGNALEALQKKRASSHVDVDILWFVSSCGERLGIPLEVPWGTQGASRVVSAKSSLHSSCEGEHRSALESWKGDQASL